MRRNITRCMQGACTADGDFLGGSERRLVPASDAQQDCDGSALCIRLGFFDEIQE